MYSQREIETTKLDTLIDEIVEQMSGHDSTEDEYAKMADQLTKLYKLRQIEIELKLKTNDNIIKQMENETNTDVKVRDSKAKQEEILSKRTALENEQERLERELELKLQTMGVEIESKQDEIGRRRRVSPDTLALVGANIIGIVMIIGHERANVIASKALGFISKLK